MLLLFKLDSMLPRLTVVLPELTRLVHCMHAEYQHGNEVFVRKIENLEHTYSHIRRECGAVLCVAGSCDITNYYYPNP